MASWRSVMKIEGPESGSISQRHGSADPDPDPHQNVMDPQHWLRDSSLLLGAQCSARCCTSWTRWWTSLGLSQRPHTKRPSKGEPSPPDLFVSFTLRQCCGSVFFESGSGCGSRVLLTQNWKKYSWFFFLKSKIAIYLSLGLHKRRSSYRKSLRSSKENIQHFKRWIF